MKKLLLSFVVLSAVAVTAQVGINTDEPKAMLDISAKDSQKGDLRIQDVEEKSTQWLLVWDEKDQKVKRTSLLDLKWGIIIEVDREKINYIRENQPDRADEIINKIKQCPPENIVFDRYFGNIKHDFVYCATPVSVGGYNRTWLNLNLGAKYANIYSTNFNPTVNKTDEAIHSDKNLYGSAYQWQRDSDGHEHSNYSEGSIEKAYSWTSIGDSSRGRPIFSHDGSWNWAEGGEKASGLDLELWRAGGINNPCPIGYHVPTVQEWQEFHQAVTGSRSGVATNQMWTQNKLPNLAAAGSGYYDRGSIIYKGPHGNYWSSSAYSGSEAFAMRFYPKSSGPNELDRRTYQLSVRCIKD
ncbi:fibrobacter succinogenes major paralogous domain [Candidatus Ornithobacterium hominis]|uniref:Fibrobacter succinogenes major paralogous domain n=1 Tax=Candidatus Ornithobacterium hominis TaxID=2497989 RepID=A0A383U260_9FLAO|nr:FISUMP domain-containing protein [Candidatus Ornithobacterium hominis]MCT7904870.1 fibrobacter succinogenes major paralogous domain-containing protein [Candidatus Ornithobacterium hominis]SZD73376.1 fibrobacter succinogenes major paralogous domain [Candidatus Ornithobacterium hominis]